MYVIFKYYLNIIKILFLNIIKIILRELSHSKFHLIPVHMKRQRGKFPWDLTFIGKTAKQLEGPSQWVGVGGGGGTPYDGLYGEAPPKRGTLFTLQVKSVRGWASPMKLSWARTPRGGGGASPMKLSWARTPPPRVPGSAEALLTLWWFALCPEVFSRGTTGPEGRGSWLGW